MMTDPIADMLTRIRNALAARHERVQIPASRMKQGYILDFHVDKAAHLQGLLDITLKYDVMNMSVIQGLRKISTPGKRQYVSCKEMPKVLDGAGIAIISTSRGLLTDQQCRAENVGGEVICFVW
jgi:small subunit ribosomal protein S8